MKWGGGGGGGGDFMGLLLMYKQWSIPGLNFHGLHEVHAYTQTPVDMYTHPFSIIIIMSTHTPYIQHHE